MLSSCPPVRHKPVYMRRNDVTESMVTIQSPFCGYSTTKCVELNGEALSCYSNKTESVSLRKCPYDHWLTDKAYLSAITVRNISRSFTYKMAAEINWHRYGTTLRHWHPMYCIEKTGLVELVLASRLSYCIMRKFRYLYKNKDTSLWSFVRNSGLRKFRHGKSIALSTKLVDGRACWPRLQRSIRRGCLLHVGQL